jgi:hypothetical protein
MYEIKVAGDVTVEGPELPNADVDLLERGLSEDIIRRLEEMGLIIEGIGSRSSFCSEQRTAFRAVACPRPAAPRAFGSTKLSGSGVVRANSTRSS